MPRLQRKNPFISFYAINEFFCAFIGTYWIIEVHNRRRCANAPPSALSRVRSCRRDASGYSLVAHAAEILRAIRYSLLHALQRITRFRASTAAALSQCFRTTAFRARRASAYHVP
ncbi:MAG: hypothetical protein FWE27_04980 [Defluviitaleaceae bacterium]|nr:hypothetical protein [Defluviitaleaceae bacterium]